MRRSIVLVEDDFIRDGVSLQRMEMIIGLTHRRGRGVKCEKPTARFAGRGCGREIAFCLPVFARGGTVAGPGATCLPPKQSPTLIWIKWADFTQWRL